MTVKVSGAQLSALQCAGLEEGAAAGLEEETLVLRAWSGRTLRFSAEDADALASALTELANAEDAQAQDTGDRACVGAARALSNLASKVRRG